MYVTAKINSLKIYLYNVGDVNMEDIYNICSNGMKRVIMSVRKLIVLVIVFDFYINTDDFLDFFIFWMEGFFLGIDILLLLLIRYIIKVMEPQRQNLNPKRYITNMAELSNY